MIVQPLDQILPEIARNEARLWEVNESTLGVPAGKYLVREFYCTELDCDCRRVLIQLLPFDNSSGKVAASINYGWERAKYYRKWSRDPVLGREMVGATLECSAEQGPHARRFLEIFKVLIKDRALVIVFRRHYNLVKEALPGLPGFITDDPELLP